VTSSWGGIRYRPVAFTEYGVAAAQNKLQLNRISKILCP
jgi:hypothetical protein